MPDRLNYEARAGTSRASSFGVVAIMLPAPL
jgi:hypothetical protein